MRPRIIEFINVRTSQNIDYQEHCQHWRCMQCCSVANLGSPGHRWSFLFRKCPHKGIRITLAYGYSSLRGLRPISKEFVSHGYSHAKHQWQSISICQLKRKKSGVEWNLNKKETLNNQLFLKALNRKRMRKCWLFTFWSWLPARNSHSYQCRTSLFEKL